METIPKQKVVLQLGEGQELIIDIAPLADVLNELGINIEEHGVHFNTAMEMLISLEQDGMKKVTAEDVLECCQFLKVWRDAVKRMGAKETPVI
jgi:hypothetical protein